MSAPAAICAPPATGARVTELLTAAERARLSGDYRAGSELARQAAGLAEAAGDGPARGEALRSMANQLLRLGEQEAAVTASREAVAVLERLGDDAGVCQVLTVQALPLDNLGMHEEALDVLSRAREIAQRLGDRDLLYWVHNRIGVVHGSLGDRRLSSVYLHKALSMSEGLDDEARFCILNNLGDNAVYEVPQLRAGGDADGARRTLTDALGYVAEALRLARDAAHPYRESICLDNFGMLRALDSDFAGADEMLRAAHELAAAHGYRSLECMTLRHLAQVLLMRGDCAAGIAGLHVVLERAEAAGETPMALEIHQDLSAAYERTGDPAAALAHYKRYHALERAAHNDVAAARARMAVHGFELDNARLEAELARGRSAELEAATLSWQRQATEDSLTGLPNRRHAELRLPEMAAASGTLGVVIADVDLFKGVNDRFGHFVGDEVLRRIAAILRDNVRDGDLVARLGGEEFLIGLDGVTPADALGRCELLRAQVAGYPWEQLEPGLAVTVSLGLALVPAGGDLPAAMVSADRRLYEAKRAGRNRVA